MSVYVVRFWQIRFRFHIDSDKNMFRIHVYVPLSMYSVHHRALSLSGWGIDVLWWLHIVEPTRCLWTCNELIGLYVSVECYEVEGSFQDTTQKNEDKVYFFRPASIVSFAPKLCCCAMSVYLRHV